jgi:hypothetical protein
MITKAPIYDMQVSEVQAYALKIERSAKKITHPQFVESQVIAPLSKAIVDMETAKTKFTTKEKTQLIYEIDLRQDKRLTGLKYILKSCLYREAVEKRESGTRLINCMKKNGWSMHKFSYTNQNMAMHNFFTEVDGSAQLTADLSVCNATGVYAEAKKENKEFNDALNIRTDQVAGSSKLTATVVCERIDEACENILQFVEVMHRVSPNEEYQRFIDEANTIAQEMEISINTRKAKATSEEEVTE